MFARFESYSPLLSSPASAACVALPLSLSLSLSLSIYIPGSSYSPLPDRLFSWLPNQCLKCMSRVPLATQCLLFQEICVCVWICVCLFPLSLHTNTHPSICPISTCAEALTPSRLTNESLPQPSVTFLAAFSSSNFSHPSISPPLSLTSPPLPSIFTSRRVKKAFPIP